MVDVLVAKLVVPTSTTCVTSVDLELFGFFTTHDNDIVFGHAFLVNHATETTIILLYNNCVTLTPPTLTIFQNHLTGSLCNHHGRSVGIATY